MKNKENTLDDYLIDPNRTTFSISHGKNFRNGPMFLGYIVLVVGIMVDWWILDIAIDPDVYFKNQLGPILFSIVGSFFILVGAFIVFSSTGVDVDVKNKQIREYTRFLRKRGHWITIEKYPFIAVLKLQKSITYGQYLGPATAYIPSRTVENEEHEICLLTKSHFQRITVDITKNYSEAIEKAEKLANDLGVTLTQFNPVKISKGKPGRKR